MLFKNRYLLEESDNIWQNHSIWQYTTKLDKIRQNTKQTYDNNVENMWQHKFNNT